MCITIATKTVCTRKDRACFGCSRRMPKGTFMVTHKTRGDGRIYTLYLCSLCDEAAKRRAYGGPYFEGELGEEWENDAMKRDGKDT